MGGNSFDRIAPSRASRNVNPVARQPKPYFVLRRKLPPFIEGFRMMAGQGVTPESDSKMYNGLMACRPYVWAIWAGVALSAFLGVWKPGA